jgi:plasmid stability protein
MIAMCYKWYKMDTTVRNLDEEAYRSLRARAVMEGRTVGELINEAIRAYLARTGQPKRTASLRDLHPEPFPEGNERLSSEIDAIVYGDHS